VRNTKAEDKRYHDDWFVLDTTIVKNLTLKIQQQTQMKNTNESKEERGGI
jgi:hypothetical protein